MSFFDFQSVPLEKYLDLYDSDLSDKEHSIRNPTLSLHYLSKRRRAAFIHSVAKDHPEVMKKLKEEIMQAEFHHRRVTMLGNMAFSFEWPDYQPDNKLFQLWLDELIRDAILAGTSLHDRAEVNAVLDALLEIIGVAEDREEDHHEEMEFKFKFDYSIMKEGLKLLKLSRKDPEERKKMASMYRKFDGIPIMDWLEVFEGDWYEEDGGGQLCTTALYTSTNESSTLFNSFPIEIIQLIIKFSADITPIIDLNIHRATYSNFESHYLASKTLLAASLVSHSWKDLAQPELLSRGFIHSPAHLDQFSTYITSKQAWSSVKTIALVVGNDSRTSLSYTPSFIQFNKLATKLTTVALHGDQVEYSPDSQERSFRNVRGSFVLSTVISFPASTTFTTLELYGIDLMNSTLHLPLNVTNFGFHRCEINQSSTSNFFTSNTNIQHLTFINHTSKGTYEIPEFSHLLPHIATRLPLLTHLTTNCPSHYFNATTPIHLLQVNTLEIVGSCSTEAFFGDKRGLRNFDLQLRTGVRDFEKILKLFPNLKKLMFRVSKTNADNHYRQWGVNCTSLLPLTKEMNLQLDWIV